LNIKSDTESLGILPSIAANDPELTALLDPEKRLEWSFSGYEYNSLLTREGNRFFSSQHTSGLGTDLDGRTGVAADLDHDGDLDLVLHNFQGHFGHPRHRDVQIYENKLGDGKSFLELHLRSDSANTRAIGSRVQATCGGQIQTRQITAGQGFGSQSPYRLFLGFRGCSSAVTLDVFWPNGEHQVFSDVSTGARLLLYQGQPVPQPLASGARVEATASQNLLQAFGQEPWQDLNGKPKLVGKSSKKSIVLFWAPWCRACSKEIPVIVNWSKQNLKTHRVFFALPSNEMSDVAKRYALKAGIQNKVIVGGDDILRAITGETYALPSTLVLDKEMKLERAFIGSKILYDQL
jgi:thiol-disulfide isomerase/thioredoxin